MSSVNRKAHWLHGCNKLTNWYLRLTHPWGNQNLGTVQTIMPTGCTTDSETNCLFTSSYNGNITYFIKYIIDICCSLRRGFHEKKTILLSICLGFLHHYSGNKSFMQNHKGLLFSFFLLEIQNQDEHHNIFRTRRNKLKHFDWQSQYGYNKIYCLFPTGKLTLARVWHGQRSVKSAPNIVKRRERKKWSTCLCRHLPRLHQIWFISSKSHNHVWITFRRPQTIRILAFEGT